MIQSVDSRSCEQHKASNYVIFYGLPTPTVHKVYLQKYTTCVRLAHRLAGGQTNLYIFFFKDVICTLHVHTISGEHEQRLNLAKFLSAAQASSSCSLLEPT